MIVWLFTGAAITALGVVGCTLQVIALLTGGRVQKAWGISALAVSGLIIVLSAVAAGRDARLAAKDGAIAAPSGMMKDNYMRVQLGSSALTCPVGIRFPLLDANLIGVDSLLSVRVDKGRLLVSTVFYDLEGKIALTLVDNRWSVSGRHERNYDERGVEVIDEYGFPIAQIEFTDINGIRVGGVIRTLHGIAIVSSGPLLTPSAPSDPWELRRTIWNEGLRVEPWFEYPSHSNLGKRRSRDS